MQDEWRQRAPALKAVVGSGRIFDDVSAILSRPAVKGMGPSTGYVHRTSVYGMPLPRMVGFRKIRPEQQAAVAQLRQEVIYELGRADKVGKKLGIVEDAKVSSGGSAVLCPKSIA